MTVQSCHNIAPSAAPFDGLYLAVCEKKQKQKIDAILLIYKTPTLTTQKKRTEKSFSGILIRQVLFVHEKP